MTTSQIRLRDYRVSVPEGQSGAWAVSRFTISETDEQRERERAKIVGAARVIPAGTYTRLTEGERVWRTDTPDEVADLREVVQAAHGKVLIAGLGLGSSVGLVLANPEVEQLIVIERYQEVIDLVGPTYLPDPRLTILAKDPMTMRWPHGVKFDTVFFDIWPDARVENLVDIKTLKHSYAHRVSRPHGWLGAWQENWLRYQQSRKDYRRL